MNKAVHTDDPADWPVYFQSPISRECQASLRFSSNPSEAAIEMLIEMLTIMRGVWAVKPAARAETDPEE